MVAPQPALSIEPAPAGPRAEAQGTVRRPPLAAREPEPDEPLRCDPRLPALPPAFDPAAVARLFAERWPAPADAADAAATPIAIRGCRLQRVRYQPRVRCLAVYELSIGRPGGPDDPGEAPRQTLGVVEVKPGGLTHRLFSDDPRLPWLRTATDGAAMRVRFAALLAGRAGAEVAGPIEACEVVPVRYEPGARCLIRYSLRTAAGRRVYFGKLQARDSPRLVEAIAALHRQSVDAPGMPGILGPAAHWPDLHLLVQPAVADGVELHGLVFDPSGDPAVRERWLRAAGGHLAALHRVARVAGPRRALAADLRELNAYRAALGQMMPRLEARFDQTIGAIAALADGRAEPAPVVSHGAFRTDQLMVQDGRVILLDLDGLCRANPARDVGNFLAYLEWKAIRQPEHAAFIAGAGQAFLDGYAAAGAGLDEAWVRLYQAAAMVKIAGRRFRGLTVREWPLVPRLLDAALATACAASGLPRLQVALSPDRGWPTADGGRPTTDGFGLGPSSSVRHRDYATGALARLVAYKAGNRALVQYRPAGDEPAEPRVVLGKLYRDLGQATRVYGIMRSLWAGVFGGAARLGVPRPLGCIPSLAMLLYVPVEGQFLDAVIGAGEAPRYLDLAARWLGALHGSRLALDRSFDLANELANLGEWAGLIGRTHWGEGRAAAAIVDRLRARASGLRLETRVPIHKDFHYEHIVVGDRLTAIDFDEARLGDPAFDVAHFCAYLDLLAHRLGSAAQGRALTGVFLDAYARQTGWTPDERFGFFYAYTCVKIGKQLCTTRGPRPWPAGQERRRQVRLMLGRGLAALAPGLAAGGLA